MERSSSRSRSVGGRGSQTTKTYELDCNECSYRDTVSGDLTSLYDALDDHERRRDDGGLDHFVDCRLVDRD